MATLRARAWLSLLALTGVMGLLLFVPAGTLRFWQAWVFLAVVLGASALITHDLLVRDPALLERRMRGGPAAEKELAQRVIVLFIFLGFIGLLVVAGLDHKFSWSAMPVAVIWSGVVLVAIGFYLIARVYRENTFTAAIVQVEQGQTVITTGPYAIVRHPLYASATLYLLGMPLALGSYWALVPVAEIFPFLIWRLYDEERVLRRDLPGYPEYQQRVRHRLVPYVW